MHLVDGDKMQKKHILLILATILTIICLGTSIGISTTSSTQESNDSVSAKVAYAYLKTYIVDENVTGLANHTLVSYILVLNITNPTSANINVDSLRVVLAGSASKIGQSTEWTNEILNIKRVFNEAQPLQIGREPMLIALTATGELSTLGIQALRQKEGYFVVATSDGSNAGSLILEKVAFDYMGENEYVYKPVFINNYQFDFRNDDLIFK
jgi:hypothetical protein